MPLFAVLFAKLFLFIFLKLAFSLFRLVTFKNKIKYAGDESNTLVYHASRSISMQYIRATSKENNLDEDNVQCLSDNCTTFTIVT